MIENGKGLIYNKLVMKKTIINILTISLCAICITGCGLNKDDAKSNILINDSSSITERIREPFEANYYNIDELKTAITDEVNSFNASNGANIKIEKVTMAEKEAVTDVELSYGNSKEFSSFNNEILFVGTPIEAQSSGYDLKAILTDVSDPSKTITTVDIMAMGDYKIVIFDYSNGVFLPEKVAYKSDNCELIEPNKVLRTEGGLGLSYVMYK